MGLTPGLSSAVDLFRKLQRDTRLDHELTDDHFFNLVITGYSLIDWVKHDPSLPAAARTPESIAGLHNEPWLNLCGDLANASKHFVLTTRVPATKEVTSKSGLGIDATERGRSAKGSATSKCILMALRRGVPLNSQSACCRFGLHSLNGIGYPCRRDEQRGRARWRSALYLRGLRRARRYLGSEVAVWKERLTVKISARLLQEFLAGRIITERFHDNSTGRNLFDHGLKSGYAISDARFESAGLDEDDDHVVLELRRDPTAAEFM
jgi:hypothetical protein